MHITVPILHAKKYSIQWSARDYGRTVLPNEKMRKILIILILTTMAFYCCRQNPRVATVKEISDEKMVVRKTKYESNIKTLGFSRDSYIHTIANYTDAKGKGIIIHNSYPKGGPINTPAGRYGHAVFWSRIINKTDTTVELNLNFPADSIVVEPATNTHFKLLVPLDIMTPDKRSKFGFGLKYMETFVVKTFINRVNFKEKLNRMKMLCSMLFY